MTYGRQFVRHSIAAFRSIAYIRTSRTDDVAVVGGQVLTIAGYGCPAANRMIHGQSYATTVPAQLTTASHEDLNGCNSVFFLHANVVTEPTGVDAVEFGLVRQPRLGVLCGRFWVKPAVGNRARVANKAAKLHDRAFRKRRGGYSQFTTVAAASCWKGRKLLGVVSGGG